MELYKHCDGIGKGSDYPSRFVEFINRISDITNLDDWEPTNVVCECHCQCICGKEVETCFQIVNHKERKIINNIGSKCIIKKILKKDEYIKKFKRILSIIEKFNKKTLTTKDNLYIIENNITYIVDSKDVLLEIKKCILCDNTKINGLEICQSHKCIVCNIQKTNESEYCKFHKCELCNNEIVHDSKYCTKHKCKSCLLMTFDESEYCQSHKCSKCNNHIECRLHLSCTGKRKDGLQCTIKYPEIDENHRCKFHKLVCKGIKNDGEKCKSRENIKDGYCKHHRYQDDSLPCCKATTSNGLRCKMTENLTKGFCEYHIKANRTFYF